MDVILGLNGFVWVSSGTTFERREGGEGFDAEGVYSDKNDVSFIRSCQGVKSMAVGGPLILVEGDLGRRTTGYRVGLEHHRSLGQTQYTPDGWVDQ